MQLDPGDQLGPGSVLERAEGREHAARGGQGQQEGPEAHRAEAPSNALKYEADCDEGAHARINADGDLAVRRRPSASPCGEVHQQRSHGEGSVERASVHLRLRHHQAHHARGDDAHVEDPQRPAKGVVSRRPREHCYGPEREQGKHRVSRRNPRTGLLLRGQQQIAS